MFLKVRFQKYHSGIGNKNRYFVGTSMEAKCVSVRMGLQVI